MTGLALAATFGFGVLVGIIGRGLWEARRRGGHALVELEVAPVGQTRPVPLPSLRRLGITVVAFVVFLNALSGFLVWRNGVADRDRVDCTVDYNIADGEARDDRNSAATTSTDAELVFLRALKSQATDPGGDPAAQTAEFVDTVQARIQALKAIKRTRDRAPYPSPDACRDGHMTDEEKIGQ